MTESSNHFHAMKVKVSFKKIILRSIQSIGPLKARYTSPLGRPVHSGTNSTSLGRLSSHAAIKREDYSLTFQPPSIAWYSFIRWHRKNENVQTSKRH